MEMKELKIKTEAHHASAITEMKSQLKSIAGQKERDGELISELRTELGSVNTKLLSLEQRVVEVQLHLVDWSALISAVEEGDATSRVARQIAFAIKSAGEGEQRFHLDLFSLSPQLKGDLQNWKRKYEQLATTVAAERSKNVKQTTALTRLEADLLAEKQKLSKVVKAKDELANSLTQSQTRSEQAVRELRKQVSALREEKNEATTSVKKFKLQAEKVRAQVWANVRWLTFPRAVKS